LLADVLGIDLAAAANAKLDDNARRYQPGGPPVRTGSEVNRTAAASG
jgi:hypothetical protein